LHFLSSALFVKTDRPMIGTIDSDVFRQDAVAQQASSRAPTRKIRQISAPGSRGPLRAIFVAVILLSAYTTFSSLYLQTSRSAAYCRQRIQLLRGDGGAGKSSGKKAGRDLGVHAGSALEKKDKGAPAKAWLRPRARWQSLAAFLVKGEHPHSSS
jgi:hypothetical protein